LEKVIRQRIRELNRQGGHVSVRTLLHWLSERYEGMNPATLWRALQRMGFVYGTSRSKSALRERDDVLIARREYLRTKLANRRRHGGTVRPEVYLDESYVNVNHSTPRTWYFAEEGHGSRNRQATALASYWCMRSHGRMGGGSPTCLPSEATDRRLPWPDELCELS